MPAKVSDAHGFYSVLGVAPSANESAIRKAYYRLALEFHPDRSAPDATQKERDARTAKFQEIGHAYEVLSDAEHRALYDSTGRDPLSADGHSAGYYADMFSRVTTADIDAFRAIYVGSAEERRDFMDALVSCGGDPIAAMESVFFAGVDDEDRFVAMAREVIESMDVNAREGFERAVGNDAAFKRGQKRRRAKAAREAKQAAKLAAEMSAKRGGTKGKKDAGDEGLYALIQKRQANRLDGLVASLEAKYAPPKRKK